MPKPSRLNPGRPPRATQTKPADTGPTVEITVLQNALDNATEECKRVTNELDSRQEAHEEAIKAKDAEIRAAEEKILRIEKELTEAKTAGAKSGDNTYDELIAMRENTEAECKRLQGELTIAKQEIARLESLKLSIQNLSKEEIAELVRIRDMGTVGIDEVAKILAGNGPDWGDNLDRMLADSKASGVPEDLLNSFEQGMRSLISSLTVSQGAIRTALIEAESAKAKAEAELAQALATTNSGDATEVDALKQKIAELAKEGEKLTRKLGEMTSKNVDIQTALDELHAKYDGKTAIETGQYQAIHMLLEELKVLDPAKRGVDKKIVQRIAEKIDELEAAKANAEAALTRAGSSDHSACSAEINRLDLRCKELEKMKDHEASLKKESENKLQGIVDELDVLRINCDDWEKQAHAEALLKNSLHETLIRLDPDPLGAPDEREKRIREALDSTNQPASPTTHKNPFKEPLVLLALVGMLIVGAFASYMFVTRGMHKASLEAAVPNASSGAPSGSVQSTMGGEVPEAEAPDTEAENAPEAAATEMAETCYPVDANVIALFFGQELRDGKINGQVPELEAGKKRIKCETAPVYDAASKMTDISGCEACVPGGPGIYKAEDYMKNLSAQIDPSCYTEPYDYKFHMWPSGQSIRISCDKLAPYDPVRNCRDIRGCNVIVPDPTKVKCSTCGQ